MNVNQETSRTTCAFDHLIATLGSAGNRRNVLQALGATALAAGTGLAIGNEAQGKNKNKRKRNKKNKQQDAPPAPQDLVACQDVILSRCLIGDNVCIASGNQCCTQLVAGRTDEAVRCLINFQPGRVQV